MRFILASLLLASLVVNLEAGKVTWGEDGKAIISGTAGAGCSENVFETQEENTTEPDCS